MPFDLTPLLDECAPPQTKLFSAHYNVISHTEKMENPSGRPTLKNLNWIKTALMLLNSLLFVRMKVTAS